jgi:ubiquitin C-terminal hydrolase
VDTQPFCGCWKGWRHELINTREQQDVFEFLQVFLDQLPKEMSSMFAGAIRNSIEGLRDDHCSSNLEPFYTLPLEIKGFKDIFASFQSSLQNELFTGKNQYSIGDRKIDVRKFSRIESAPQILVIQLKRFEYNLATWERVKVKDRYEFPQSLNIGPYLADNSRDEIYSLKGVILHSGTAQGGHYSSLVRIGEKWIKFNDIEVTELREDQFEEATFGSSTPAGRDDYNAATSAYLLFYVKRGATALNLSFDTMPNVLEKCDP